MIDYRSKLTDIDIRRLVKATDEVDRATAAHKLCRTMETATLTAEEREAAQDILRLMAGDAAEMVRRAMAVTLKSSTLLPRDVARRLAADVDSVALPLLEVSPVFTDEDLIEIVRAGSMVRQVAIAARPKVSRQLAEVIAFEAGDEFDDFIMDSGTQFAIQTRTLTVTETGARTAVWATAQTLYGSLQPVSAQTAAGYAMRGINLTHELWLGVNP
jgi:hypothetical protein